MNEINPVFRKTSKLGKRVLVVLTVIIVVAFLQGATQLLLGSYLKKEKQLFRLEAITLLAKAYTSSGGRHGGKSLHFEDTNRYRYLVDNVVYNSILKRDFLRDTLEYHGTKLTVYTDKNGYEAYLKKLKNKNVDVYQLEVGNMQYIDLEKANHLRKRGLIFRVSLLALVLIGILGSYRKLRHKADIT